MSQQLIQTNQIGGLPADQITSGVFDISRIPDVPATKLLLGSPATPFDVSLIPDLDASKITSGVLDLSRIPNLPASQITNGTFDTARIPSLDASKIGSGTLAAARLTGTYNIDISGNAATATDATDSTQLNSQSASYYTNASNLSSGTLSTSRLPANTQTVILETPSAVAGPDLTVDAWTTLSVSAYVPSGTASVLISGFILTASTAQRTELYISKPSASGRPTPPNVVAGNWPALSYVEDSDAGVDYFSGNNGHQWVQVDGSRQIDYYMKKGSSIGNEAYIYILGYTI
jgi:hypothetical protein